MKRLFILFIKFYQAISIIIKQLMGVKSACRFNTTCSTYAILCIEKHGLLMGLKLSAIRLIRCQPFSKYADF